MFLPKGKVSVNDILFKEGVADLLKELKDNAWTINNFVLVYSTEDGDVNVTYNSQIANTVYLLEMGKKVMLEGDDGVS